MADETTPSAKAPCHLWVVAVLSLLWNLFGAMDFVMTQTRNPAYLKAFTPAQLEYFNHFPLWAVLAWGVAVWGGVFGSGLLLIRRHQAAPLFLASLAGMALTDLHSYVLTDGLTVMGGPKALVFASVIFVIGVLLLVYARAMTRRGVLR